MDYRNMILESGLNRADFPHYAKGDQIFEYKLLLKQHYETGISYLCITKQKNYIKYTGSGKRWKRLLQKIESRILTTLLYTTDDADDLAFAAAWHSLMFDIPRNENFANVVPELGYENNQGNLPMWYTYASAEDIRRQREKQSLSYSATLRKKKFDGIPYPIESAQARLREETGLQNYMQIPAVASKCRAAQLKTLQERYGVQHNMHIPGIAQKVTRSKEKSMLEKYGVKNIMELPEFHIPARKKAIETLLRERGVSNISQTEGWSARVGPKISAALKARPKVRCKFCSKEYQAIKTHEDRCINNPDRIHPVRYACVHCGILVEKTNLTRWHNDNCKHKGK